MATVALVGGDGSGKTTIAKYLVQTSKLPIKYIYMGLSTMKRVPAFPTTLLIRYYKFRSYKNSARTSGVLYQEQSILHDYHHNQTKRRDLWHAIHGLNFLIDVLYRQVYSWVYVLRGYLVIYNRLCLCMAAPEFNGNREIKRHWIDRTLYWVFNNILSRVRFGIFPWCSCRSPLFKKIITNP